LPCLRRIDTLILGQSIEKDKTFLERPRLLILINFVKNMIDGNTSGRSAVVEGIMATTEGDYAARVVRASGVIPVFPSIISLFLARAALHVLQPGHELFAK